MVTAVVAAHRWEAPQGELGVFETDPSIGISAVASRNRDVANSNARMSAHFEGLYERWRAHAKGLEAKVASLEAALAVEKAAAEGHAAVVEAFKAQHASSPLLVQEGTLRNGQPRRRSTSIWIAAFDRTARAMGITTPEAHRIS